MAVWFTSASRSLDAQAVGADLPDAQWAAIAERVPGFAGWWYEGDIVVLMLVDTTRRADALKEIASDLRRRYVSRIRVQKADFDFKQLRDWKELVPLDTVLGVTMIDADEVRNRVVVGVVDSAHVAGARRHLLALGIPRRALVIFVAGYVCSRGGVPAVAVHIRTEGGAPAAAGARVILDGRDTAWSMPLRDAVVIHVDGDHSKRHTVRVDKPWYHTVIVPDVSVNVDRCGVVATTLVPIQLRLRPEAPAIRSLYVGRRGLFAGGRYRSQLAAVLDAAPGVSDSVTWSSSDTTVALVDAHGVMTTLCRKTYRSAFIRATLVADTTIRDSLVMGAGPSAPGVAGC